MKLPGLNFFSLFFFGFIRYEYVPLMSLFDLLGPRSTASVAYWGVDLFINVRGDHVLDSSGFCCIVSPCCQWCTGDMGISWMTHDLVYSKIHVH